MEIGRLEQSQLLRFRRGGFGSHLSWAKALPIEVMAFKQDEEECRGMMFEGGGSGGLGGRKLTSLLCNLAAQRGWGLAGQRG